MEFAERLKQLMDENGTSNYELAKNTGTHQTSVANWLSGSIPQARKLKAIADYFNVSIEYLKGETDTKEKAATVSGDDLSRSDIEFLKKLDMLNPDFQRLIIAVSELDAEALAKFADLAEAFVKTKARQ